MMNSAQNEYSNQTQALSPASRTSFFELRGNVDAIGVQQLREKLDHLADLEENLCIDMSQVEYIDSSGIGLLVFLYKRLLSKGFELSLQGLHGQPQILLHLLRIDRCISTDTH